MYNIYLKLKSFDLDYLIRTENYLFSIFYFFSLNQIKHKINSKKSKKITVLRSPHIDKKSREQFQLITYKRTLIITLSDKNIVFFFLKSLKTSKFLGVELEILIEFSSYENF